MSFRVLSLVIFLIPYALHRLDDNIAWFALASPGLACCPGIIINNSPFYF